MAIWEIMFESGTSGYSLSNGQFKMGSYGTVQTNAIGLGQGYLNSLSTWSVQPGYQFSMLTATTGTKNQRQIFFNQSAVPEPASWALMILGFGLVGGVLRKQRKSTQLAFV